MAYIYKITNQENGKFYIGKTKRKSLTRRWFEHQYKARQKDYRHPLYDSIKVYGLEKFVMEVIEECDESVLSEKEASWIEKLSPQYNLTKGGEGGDTFSNRSEKSKRITRNKLSRHAKKLWKNEEYRNMQSELAQGRWKNEEYRNVQSTQMKEKWGNETYRQLITRKAKEKAQDPEHIRKLSEAGKKKAQDPEYRKKVSEGVKNAISTRKDIWSECKIGSKNGRWIGNIEMYDNLGNLVKTYDTAVDCHNDTGMVAHHIRTHARSNTSPKRGKYKGFTFRLT